MRNEVLGTYWALFSEDVKGALPFYSRDLEGKKRVSAGKKDVNRVSVNIFLLDTDMAVIPINTSIEFCLPQLLFAAAAAAAAKSLQSSPTLCNPIDSSPPGSSIPGILQARTLEWVAISLFASQAIKTKPGLSLNQGTMVLLDQAGVDKCYP